MDDCAFCRIVAGDREARRLYEDDRTLVFLDDDPATPGHALVIPKRHAGDLLRADEDDATAVMHTARALATAMDAVLEPDGYSLFHTTGDLVGRVEHAHLHVVPRTVDDGIHMSLDRTSIDADEETALAERLRAELSA